ncbi:MAG: protein tyrosine phosphatase family protein [Desulfobacter sp.]
MRKKTGACLQLVKIYWGFLISLLHKYTPLTFGGDRIQDIFSYYKYSNILSSSGQPTEAQFYAIREAGFKTVINLLPRNTENSLDHEAELVETLGMKYIHIPVEFFHPTEDNFSEFAAAMQAVSREKTWVHCAANARASAFIYKYRTTVLKEDPDTAKWDVREIWEPYFYPAWRKFISWERD